MLLRISPHDHLRTAPPEVSGAHWPQMPEPMLPYPFG